jgi:hypothetical protein
MIASLFFNVIALFFALKASLNKNSNGLLYSVIIIFIFLAIRYDFGNDYLGYFMNFDEINEYNFFSIKGNEIGWIYLNYIFGPFGFIGMQIFLAGFSCYILYRFIKKYVPQNYYWIAIFIYTFQPYHLLVFSSAMRQAIVISFFLLAIDYLIEKKPFHYIAIIMFSTLFHTTALFLLPIIIFSYVKIKPKISFIILLTIISYILYIFKEDIFILSGEFITLYFEKEYSSHLNIDLSNVSIGLGFLLNFFIYIILFYQLKNTNVHSEILIFNITALSFLLMTLTLSIPLVSRINFYFTPLLMIAYPIALRNMKLKVFKHIFILLIIISNIYQYFIFFHSTVWIEKFYNYKTIFSI